MDKEDVRNLRRWQVQALRKTISVPGSTSSLCLCRSRLSAVQFHHQALEPAHRIGSAEPIENRARLLKRDD